MSWVEAESGGADGVVENPDPEEDSDLPSRRLHGQAEEGARLEQDRPEDDLNIAAVDPDGDQASGACGDRTGDALLEGAVGASAENHAGSARDVVVEHAPVYDDAVPQESNQSGNTAVVVKESVAREVSENMSYVETSVQPGHLNVADGRPPAANVADAQAVEEEERSEENEGHANADIEEEDSFDQDEETAAPECETGVRLDSTSESDRQPVNFQDEAEGNPVGESEDRGASNTESSSLSNGVYSNSGGHMINSGNLEESCNISHDSSVPSAAAGSANSNAANFSGNIEVSDSAEDAPEAELDNLQLNSLQIREAEFLANRFSRTVDSLGSSGSQAADSERHPHAPDSSNSNHSNPGQSPGNSEDHDMQAPECDRETSPQLLNEAENLNIRETAQSHTVSNEHISSDNSVSSSAEQEGILRNMCQQPNTSDSLCSGAPPEQDKHSESNPILETSEERLETRAQFCIEETGQIASESESLNNQPCGYQSSCEQSPMMQATNHLKEQSFLKQSQPSVNSSLEQSSVNRISPAAQELSDPSPSPPSFGATSKPCAKINSVQKEGLSPKVSGRSTPTMANNAFSSATAQRKEGNASSQKGASNSSSSSSSNTSQRTSPAKAVAAALFHVMGMDSKFTGKDLALALQSDDEDDLMSELNAELLSTSVSSKAKLPEKPEQRDHVRRHHKTKAKQEPQTRTSEMTNGLPSSNDELRLQEHNRQLLEQLRIRDEEISR